MLIHRLDSLMGKTRQLYIATYSRCRTTDTHVAAASCLVRLVTTDACSPGLVDETTWLRAGTTNLAEHMGLPADCPHVLI